MSDKEKKLQKLAKLAKILEQGSPAIARFLFDLEDKLEQAVIDLSSVISDVSQQTSDRDNELKKEFDDIKPTDERLVEIIKPLIPKVKDGVTPSKNEIIAIIKPLIPQVENGKTPTKEELLALIRPLIPQIDTDKVVAEAVSIVESRIKIPNIDKIEKRVDTLDSKVSTLKDETETAIEQIQEDVNNIAKQERTIVNKYYGGGGGGGASKFTELSDTFTEYSGKAGKGLRVNSTETGIDTYTPTDTDEKVKLSASDPTSGYLDDKITAYQFDDSFLASDWVLNGSNYELTEVHNLNTSNPKISVLKSSSQIFTDSVIIVDVNTIKLSVPASPDLRFDGSVSISSI